MNAWVAVGGDRVWVAGDVMAGELVRNTLAKAAGDAVTLEMDFGDLPELAADSVITDVTSVLATPVGLAIGTPAIAGGYRVVAKFEGGTVQTDYAVTFLVVLTGGTVISRSAILKVV